MGSFSLLQGIFPTQGSNPGLPHCSRVLHRLSPREALTGYQEQSPRLRSRSLLVLYFVLSSVCMSVPNKTLLSRPRFSHLQHGDNKSLPDLYSLPLMILFRLQLDDTVELLSVVSISPNPWSLASLYAEHCKAAIPPAAQKIKEIKRT